MSFPLISVILPVYNAELYVRESIQSVLNQSFSDFELIVLNDGSTDGSEKVILEFQDERIKYVKNETNLKLIDTLNLGLQLAEGKYIARIDADDIALPTRFEAQVDFLELNHEYGILGAFAETFGSKNDVLRFVEDDEDIRFAFVSHNPFIHSTVMLRSSILKKYGLTFSKDQLHVEDYDLWIKVLKYSKGKILPHVLIKYRIHEEQVSNKYNIQQINNAYKLQFTYLSEHIRTEENKLILFYLNTLQLTCSNELIFLLEKIDRLIKDSNCFEQKFYMKCFQKVKNQMFNLRFITFESLCSVIFSYKLFSFKQKCYFCLKFLRIR